MGRLRPPSEGVRLAESEPTIVRLRVACVLGLVACDPEPQEASEEPAEVVQVDEEPAPAEATPAVEVELEVVSDDPPTGLPLQLLATLAAATPADGRATIRDEG